MTQAGCSSIVRRAVTFYRTAEIWLLGGRCLICNFFSSSLFHTFLLFLGVYLSSWWLEEDGKKSSSIYRTSPPCLIIHYRIASALIHGLKGWIFINWRGYNYRALHPSLFAFVAEEKQTVEHPGNQSREPVNAAFKLSPASCPNCFSSLPLLPPFLTWQNSQKLLQNWRQLPLCM